MPAKKQKRILYIIAVIGLLIFFHYINFLRPIESFVANTFSPVLSGLYNLSSNIKDTYKEQSAKIDLNKINTQLQDEIAKLTTENAKLKILEEENKSLRQYMKFFAKNEQNYILGNIISRGDIFGAGQTLIIDKGTKDGVTPGLSVVSSYGVVVGKVVAARDNISDVYLTTNQKSKMAAAIQNTTKTSGIARGELGLTIKMEYIPQTENLKDGDIVVTSGLEPNIPRGLVIGKVTQIDKENNELWQTATIEPMVDLDDLVVVSVVLPKK